MTEGSETDDADEIAFFEIGSFDCVVDGCSGTE
jgi:hypothetical protein